MKFNGIEITKETILRTREYFIEASRQCIKDVESGKDKVGNPEGFIKIHQERIDNVSQGKSDHTFAFMQRAYYLQTGKSVALLPRTS